MAMPTVALLSLTDRLDQLPTYYTYKDVLTIVFADDEDAFLDAYCDGRLPSAVRALCAGTMGDTLLQTWLLRRVVRQLNMVLQECTHG